MHGFQRLGIALGAPLLLAGAIGGAVAFASEGGGSNDPNPRPAISQQEPDGGAAPHDKGDCPEKDGGSGASASEL